MTGRFLRQTLVIARRDFTAIVFTPTFLVFLLAPLLMVGFAAIGGVGAAQLADGGAERARIVAVLPADEGRRFAAADAALRGVFRPGEAPPELIVETAGADPAKQARSMLDAPARHVVAVLSGPLAAPTILYRPHGERAATWLGEVAERALAGAERRSAPRRVALAAAPSADDGRQSTGFGAVFLIFFLTLLLAGQSVGMLAEERTNKVIEILAAAVPLESVFLGKLIGMFGVALLFIAFWATLLGQGLMLLPDHAALIERIAPAVGMPLFVALFLIYFTLAFLLLGAVFLGVGAQAGSMREIQMLSLPITLFQVGMFGLSSAAAARPDSAVGLFAAIFPFSSPFAMAARAATSPAILPHLAAIAWQMAWVAATVMLAARLFRRGVLKSGGAAPARH
ncbi:ABC transporter permease [Sphingomonas flavalba]|uniref:ABC transporter permease n=1 Tax=Sphingomonas flavalba TaxID=2559804 RepID=UPI00109DDA44|nr:ABC transporter permease [Sphingomonas flavalba]